MNISDNQFSKSSDISEQKSYFKAESMELRFFDKSVTPGEDDHFRLTEPLEYYSQIKGEIVEVHPKFHTDFASVPQLLLFIVPRVGKYGRATVIHDYLCRESDKSDNPFESRKEADAIFLEAMEVLNVRPFTRQIMFWAVQLWTRKIYRFWEQFIPITTLAVIAVLAILAIGWKIAEFALIGLFYRYF